jgi:hypothetical protein
VARTSMCWTNINKKNMGIASLGKISLGETLSVNELA